MFEFLLKMMVCPSTHIGRSLVDTTPVSPFPLSLLVPPVFVPGEGLPLLKFPHSWMLIT
jgi:hypothetical protein